MTNRIASVPNLPQLPQGFNGKDSPHDQYHADLQKALQIWATEYMTTVNNVIASQLTNGSSASQTVSASTHTYVTGSSLPMPPSGMMPGSWFRWVISLSKNAAGFSSPPSVSVRFGTAGAVGDTERLQFTFGNQTSAADTAMIEVLVNCVAIGAAGSIQGCCRLIKGNTGSTGFSTTSDIHQLLQVTSGSFNTTVADSKIGLSIHSGGATYTLLNVAASSGKI